MLSNKSFLYLCYFWLLIHFWDVEAATAGYGTNKSAASTYASVRIGLILDSTSPVDEMVNLSISMAVSDFYAVHTDYQTRLDIQRMYAQDELGVASAAFELMKNEEVQSILGPQTLTQDKVVAELGGKAHIPVISFTARSQSGSHKQSPYVIRTAPDDSNQARALASICEEFAWHSAVILFEDSDYGTQFLLKLTQAFQEAQIQLAYTVSISTSADDHQIMNELRKLMTMQTRVFLVHMNANLGSRLFLLADLAKMMSHGYAWIVTDSIGNFMHSMDDAVIDSMEGVIGLKPYMERSKKLDNFRARWKKNMLLMNVENLESSSAELNMYCLWAYDTVWALALAVEKIRPVNPGFVKPNLSNKGSEIPDLQISRIGPELFHELQNTKRKGLSGDFHLMNGHLKCSAVEIFNVHDTGERRIGYWTPERGIMRKLSSNGGQAYSTSTKELKSILWPGDSTKKPIGFAIPLAEKLRVGVPMKEGFKQFVDVSQDPLTKKTTNVTGYSIEIFCSVLKLLPFHIEPEFHSFTNESGLSKGTYDDLLYAIPNKTYDMVVGDTTILPYRAAYVDFTLPYSEAGTVMVVRNRERRNIWIFVKPFSWDLWVLIFATSICIGIVLRILEHRTNSQSDSIGVKKHNLGLSFPIASLAFPERDLVTNEWSRFVMVVWLLMAFILMQSYTANLSAMFTVDQLDYRFSSDDCIGVQDGSFVRDFLKKQLKINDTRIKDYSTIEQYHEAMRNGSKNGGIDAIFDEIPYMKLFLDRYGSEYKIVGHTYKSDGFGFAFSKGSPLVAYFSRAILAFTDTGNFTEIQEKYFGPSYSSSSNPIGSETPDLRVYDFGGLFIIIGSALLLALFCSETKVGQRLTDIVAYYSQKYFSFQPYRGNDSRIDSTVHPEDDNGVSSSDEKHQGSDNSDQESVQGDLNRSAIIGQVIEFEQGNPTNEIQLSEVRNINVTEERQTN